MLLKVGLNILGWEIGKFIFRKITFVKYSVPGGGFMTVRIRDVNSLEDTLKDYTKIKWYKWWR